MHCQDSAAPNASPARSLGLDASLQNQPRLSSRTKVPPQICSQYKSHINLGTNIYRYILTQEMDLRYNYYIPKHYLFNLKCTKKNMISKSTQEPANIQKNESFPKSADSIKSPKMDLHSLVSPLQHHLNAPWPRRKGRGSLQKPPFSLGNVEKCG